MTAATSFGETNLRMAVYIDTHCSAFMYAIPFYIPGFTYNLKINSGYSKQASKVNIVLWACFVHVGHTLNQLSTAFLMRYRYYSTLSHANYIL